MSVHSECDLRPAWLHITPVSHVDLVHLGKVIHAGQEDIDLDDLVDVGTGGLENSRQVLDTLVLDSVSYNLNRLSS